MSRRAIATSTTWRKFFDAFSISDQSIVIDTETSGFDPTEPAQGLVGISIYAPDLDVSLYVPINHILTPKLDPFEVVSALAAVCVNRPIIMHNSKFDWKWLHRYGWVKPPTHDTMLMVKCLDFLRKVGLKDLAAEAGIEMTHIDSIVDFKTQTMADIQASVAGPYAMADAEQTWGVYQREWPVLQGRPQIEIYNLEMRLIVPVAEMELNGVRTDAAVLEEVERAYEEIRIRTEMDTRSAIYNILGCGGTTSTCTGRCATNAKACEISLHSPARLASVLYGTLLLPTDGIKETQNGWSTDADSIKTLVSRTGNAWLQSILDYKEAVKQKGMAKTYREAIGSDGAIHSDLSQYWVITGRFASSGPNMQQVPKGRRGQGMAVGGFRKAFVPHPGFYFVDADFSQVEMRIFAALAGAQQLLEAFKQGEDIHRKTASLAFGVPQETVTKDQRDTAKTVGFGLIYGQVAKGLAETLRCTEAQAQKILDSFFQAIPEFPKFVAMTHRFAMDHGGVQTQYGRWVPIPEVYDRNRWVQAKALRLSVNARIQGSAADCMKIAILKTYLAIQPYGEKVRMVLTVHDELLFEVHESISPEEIIPIIVGAMQQDFGPVLLKAEGGYGPDWGSIHELGATGLGEIQIGEEQVSWSVRIDMDVAATDPNLADLPALFEQYKTESGLTALLVINGVESMLQLDSGILDVLKLLDSAQKIIKIR